MNATEYDNLIIEVKNEGLFIDKKVVDDLKQYIQYSFDCKGKVILMIDRNIEHKKNRKIMDVLKESGCEKISIASI
ncbi:ExbD/TolR family protein [Thalassotalea montiporae]